jgi:hypothetical protein
LILIHLIDGIQVEIDENAITLVYGPYPHDVGPLTYIHTLGQAVLVTTMDAGTLLALMNVIPPLVKFTRPDLTPVWVKRSAVNAVRPPLPTERQSGGEAGAVLIIGDVRQTVHEDVSSASAKLTSQDFSADKPEQRSWSYRRLRVNRIIFPVSETLGPPSSGRSLSSPPSLRFQNESSGITDNAEYLVWYGTNRRPRNPNKPSEGFSALRDSVVHYGSCLVYVPRSHKIGSLGSPLWKRLVTMTDDRLLLRAINALEEKVNWEDIAAHLASIDADDRTALISVHGYNVSFRNAALRAAQIGFDLSIKGAMAFFSWPSKGTIAGYLAALLSA